MKQITSEEFFATVGQMNVHPRAERDASYWETPQRVLMGVTYPGYLEHGNPNVPKTYFVTDNYASGYQK